jgi:sugar phosphate permease
MLVGFGSAIFVALTGVTGLLFTAALPLWISLLVVRGLLGCTSAPLHPTGARLVGNWIPPSGASLANGLITGAACVGMASTFLVFGRMIDDFGWPSAFLISGAVTLIVALTWTALAADHPPEAPGAQPGAEKKPQQSLVDAVRTELAHTLRMLKNRSLLFLTLSYGALGYFQYLFFYWAEYYFEGIRNLSKETSRGYASTLTLAMGAGMILGGLISDRMLSWFGPRRGLKVIPHMRPGRQRLHGAVGLAGRGDRGGPVPVLRGDGLRRHVRGSLVDGSSDDRQLARRDRGGHHEHRRQCRRDAGSDSHSGH